MNNKTIKRIMDILMEKGEEQFELLIQLAGALDELDYIAEDNNEELEYSEEMLEFKKAIGKARKTRLDELINAEKTLKENLNDKYDIAYEKEAREFIKKYMNEYDGKEISYEVLDVSKSYEEKIWNTKTFKDMLYFYDTVRDTFSTDYTNNKEELDISVYNALFATFIAVGEVLREIDQKDWKDLDDYKCDINEEDEELEVFISEYVKEMKDEADIDMLREIIKFGFDDVYVRHLENKYGEPYIALFDGNENQLTDVIALC